MKRNIAALLGLVVIGVVGMIALLSQENTDKDMEPVAEEPPIAEEPAPTSNDGLGLAQWVEAKARGEDVPETPPNIQLILESYNLDPAMWETYRDQSAEALGKRLKQLEELRQPLVKKTRRLTEKRRELLDQGDQAAARELMESEIITLFAERDKLLGEALLVVHAKAAASGFMASASP